jgi:hypothetical protein
MNSPKRSDGTQAQLERLAFIEFRLWFLGDVRRPDLVDRFQIGPAVATRDLAAYRELAPQNIVFNDSRKVYEPTPEFNAIFTHDVERVLTALSRGYGDGFGRVTEGFLLSDGTRRLNQPDLQITATITRAIHQSKPVSLFYHSVSSGRAKRVIVPYALVDSGERWHIRAFDRKHQEFRDFVLTRMEKPTILDEDPSPHELPAEDHQWTRIVQLELIPHPDHPRPEVVIKDYGMSDGVLRLNIRATVLGYTLQQWQVDCSPDHRLDPIRNRLFLKDATKVLHGVSSAVLAPGYTG